jgi:SOS-response transcriptional repressor LexA
MVLLMHPIQKQLLELSQKHDLSQMGLREIARIISVNNPQTVKYHLSRLVASGLLKSHDQTFMIQKNVIGHSDLISIPILGTANAGPATHFAENRIEGYLRVSSALLPQRNYKDLYALRITGSSMNMAKLNGEPVRQGDYVVVDSAQRSPLSGEYVIAVVDGLANIKKFFIDVAHNQIALLSESTQDFSPIFIHPDDEREGLISGKVIHVIRKPDVDA